MAIPRGTRCSEAGCPNYCDDEHIGPSGHLCKVCRDELLIERLYESKYVHCTDGRASNGNRSAEAARLRRENEDAIYQRKAAPPRVNVLECLRLMEDWSR